MSQKTVDEWKTCKLMQGKGMFGRCESAPPKLCDITLFSKQATGSKNQATAKLQEAGILQKARAEKEEKNAVTFLADCQCFSGEVKFSIQTQASAQSPHQDGIFSRDT